MIQRCSNPNFKQYHNYGGRGISVCERWRDFLNFLADMGDRPADLTLDRIDNNGDYEPGNCRWTDRKTQQRHRVRYVEWNGEIRSITEWATYLQIPPSTMYTRLSRWGVIEKTFCSRGPAHV